MSVVCVMCLFTAMRKSEMSMHAHMLQYLIPLFRFRRVTCLGAYPLRRGGGGGDTPFLGLSGGGGGGGGGHSLIWPILVWDAEQDMVFKVRRRENRVYNFTIERLKQGVFLNWKPFKDLRSVKTCDERSTFVTPTTFFLNIYSLRASSPIWASEAFSRDSFHSPEQESLLAG